MKQMRIEVLPGWKIVEVIDAALDAAVAETHADVMPDRVNAMRAEAIRLLAERGVLKIVEETDDGR